MHLDAVADGIKTGAVLKKGDLIGYVGNTGNAAVGATHLHFEIRDGRTPTDPYPRLTEEFTTAERVEAAEDIIKDSDDEDEEAEKMIGLARSTFVSAIAQGIEIPDELQDALGYLADLPTIDSGYARDLTLGASGSDVIALQSFLISKNSGAAALALASAGATGYFGPITQAALAEYQASENILPSVGYYGPLTRAHIAQN